MNHKGERMSRGNEPTPTAVEWGCSLIFLAVCLGVAVRLFRWITGF